MGLYVTYVGGKGRNNKRKIQVLESVFFSWFSHVGLYVFYVGGKGRSNKQKNHILERVIFSWFSMSPMWGPREEVTNEKTTS